MKSFKLGTYKGLNISNAVNVTALDVEMNEAIRIISMELEEDEKPLLGELLPLVKENIEEEKTRLVPSMQMDRLIGAIAEQCEYEFDEEELKARTDKLCKDFVVELTENRGIGLQEYFTLRNINPGDFVKECRLESSRRLLTEAVLDSVIEVEGITLNSEEQRSIADKDNDGLKSQLRSKAMVTLLEYNLSNDRGALKRM